MLYLFDIDGTLVDTGGAGMAALKEANLAVFGHEGPELDLAGSTDLGLVGGLLAHFQIEPTPQRVSDYFAAYHDRLDWNLAHGGFAGRVLDGASELLDALARRSEIVGLLTGNTEVGASAKMRYFALDRHFRFGAYGSDHADRNLLGPIALKRAAAHAGRSFTASETLVIGDTPKDIACAHAIGARCLAVATGRFSAEELESHGADHIAESLTDALAWL